MQRDWGDWGDIAVAKYGEGEGQGEVTATTTRAGKMEVALPSLKGVSSKTPCLPHPYASLLLRLSSSGHPSPLADFFSFTGQWRGQDSRAYAFGRQCLAF